MGFLDKFFSKFTNRASDKLADKAVNKLFGKDKAKAEKVETTEKPAEPVQATETPTQTPTPNVNINPAQMAMMGAFAAKGAKDSIAQANEVMKYFIFDDNMEIIGVKDDAPDYLKAAYKSGKLNSKNED